MDHIKYPHIGSLVDVRFRVEGLYGGLNLPTISYKGTVKLHGTNAAVCVDFDKNVSWLQSRSRIITVENDNAGFAKWMLDRKIDKILSDYMDQCQVIRPKTSKSDDSDLRQLAIYGEYCGEGIQSGVGVSTLPRMFVIFDIVAITNTKKIFLTPEVEQIAPLNALGIYSIEQFATYKVQINFAKTSSAIDQIVAYTKDVENECPVTKYISGKTGVGEGIVWRPTSHLNVLNYEDYIFKTKGEKHKNNKSPKLVSADVDAVRSAEEFAKYALTEARLEQAWQYTYQNRYWLQCADHKPNIKGTGIFVRWLVDDVLREENHTITTNNLKDHLVRKALSRECANWYKTKIGYTNG